MSNGFQRVLDHIRAIAGTEAEKGRLFERLMKTYFHQDPLYGNRFSDVWLWSEWRPRRPESGPDIGIDLVAEERGGGYCAIQCKCHAPGTRIDKKALDSFISASARVPFTARIVVDTGDGWGPNAIRTPTGLEPECHVLRFGDLASRPFDWPDLVREAPEALSLRRDPFRLRPHQQQAFDDVLRGLAAHDRGKLIMACGTGKTFTALRIAERVAGESGRVLYLVPSISLFQQSMREWAEQRALPHRYIGICSDARAGRSDEDASFLELEIPVTTDRRTVGQALRFAPSGAMTVVFCTYHSLGLVERAQDEGAPPFDLVLCDEAHRTTGVERPGDKTSPFVLVHDATRIRAHRRLYMTATPRLYTEGAKTRAASHRVEVFSMDDGATFGPEFHRLPFSRAVEQDLLSDYKVVVLALSEAHADQALQAHLASSGGTINLSDAARMIGCWQALRNPENRPPGEGPIQPLGRAITFTKTIASSKLLAEHWSGVVEQTTALLPEAERRTAFRCETRHVDGQNHALERKARIEWLKGSTDGACRILSNARCLSEGIDVPALDAVIFMTERRSVVDVVQAVGRAMRKAEGKTHGYIVLPVAVPAGRDPALVLDSGKEFDIVWSVLRALRSHDDRLDAEINKIDLNDNPTDRIVFNRDGIDGDALPDAPALPFPPLDLPPGAIYAKIVEKCGDRRYWESWAKDVADIFKRLVTRIEGLLAHPDNVALNEWFEAFHEELRVSINDAITTQSAIDMMAQHLLTRPVFEALFEHYDFAGGNPVARALDALRRDFGEFGLENETRDLEGFYESVRLRARGLDNPEARQRVLMELYEKFFATAMKKDAERLGIVYTPVEIVDFILTSADAVLRREFGRSLGSEGVHVLDPFTGTGIFLVRLLQSALIDDANLKRKYREELHANELVLLAYYIAAIHIEEAFRGRIGDDGAHEPFVRHAQPARRTGAVRRDPAEPSCRPAGERAHHRGSRRRARENRSARLSVDRTDTGGRRPRDHRRLRGPRASGTVHVPRPRVPASRQQHGRDASGRIPPNALRAHARRTALGESAGRRVVGRRSGRQRNPDHRGGSGAPGTTGGSGNPRPSRSAPRARIVPGRSAVAGGGRTVRQRGPHPVRHAAVPAPRRALQGHRPHGVSRQPPVSRQRLLPAQGRRTLPARQPAHCRTHRGGSPRANRRTALPAPRNA